MRHSCTFTEPSYSSAAPISGRRRRWLRWVFAVIFGAGLVSAPLGARQVPFGSQQVISTLANGAQSVFAADVDGDGDVDVLSASSDDKIAWYENTDGAGTFGSQQVISTAADFATSVFAADVDGDGDADVLSASRNDGKVAWYENTNGAGTFGSQQVITTLADFATSVFAVDVDGDGDQDVLSASYNNDEIAWYENTDGMGAFGSEQLITTVADGARAVFAADVDGDGDVDVLSASGIDDKIAWYENTDGAGTFGSEQVITTLADFAFSVFAADVDGDGDPDVLSASRDDDKIAWYENADGAGAFGSQQVIAADADGARSVFAADVDGDGDIDVLAASGSNDKIAWYENTDGAGTFGSEQVITTLADLGVSVFVADVDGDGDLDALSASLTDDKIAWYENETIHRSAAFLEEQVIDPFAGIAASVFAADIDGDGDLDVLSAAINNNTVAWHENTDGAGAFGSKHVISFYVWGANSVFGGDVDGDGDVDVLTAAKLSGSQISWFENTDGAGAFGPEQVITTDVKFAHSVFGADVDGDGDLDALSTSSSNDDKIAWYKNTDGAGTFGPQRVITTAADGAWSVFAADVDGDGDIDVLSASTYDDKIAWYENTNGAGMFGAQQVITNTAARARSVFAADVDGDGDIDVLSASRDDDQIAWYENTDGAGSFGSQQVITTAADGAHSVFAADVDADGDVDVMSASIFGDEIAWYENTDGAGAFGSRQVIAAAADGAFAVFAADVDGDGDEDVLSALYNDDQIAWYENRGGQFALGTTDVAQGVVANDQVEDLLAIQVIHRGRAGDSPLELASLELRLTDGAGSALTETQALALFQTIRVYLDDGSGVFDGADSLVVSTSDFSSITTNGDGVLTVPVVDGDPHAQVEFGTPKTFLAVAEMTVDADTQTPSTFAFEHRTESSTGAEDANADIPLTLESVEDFQGAKVDTTLTTASCQAPFDLNLENQTVDATVTCEAGTVLRAGSGFVVISPGDLTFRAGQTIEFSNEFEVEGGSLLTEIDPGLEP